MAEKTRVRSSIDALPDAEREMLNGWLADVNTSYEEIADRLEKLLKMVRDIGQERTFAYMKYLLGCEKDY